MKKIIFCICLITVVLGIMGCGKKDANSHSNETISGKSQSTEEKADINNLFADIPEISSIKTSRGDIQYTIETNDLIKNLMILLKGIKFTEYVDTDKYIEKDGSDNNYFALAFVYKDGSKKVLDFSLRKIGVYVRYSETSVNPSILSNKSYTIEKSIGYDVMEIMKKGQIKDLNEK